MKHPTKIVVGSRGSLLATTQTRWVISQIQKQYPECEVELQIISTLGDLDQKTALTDFKDWGIFVKELQKALLEEQIDLVVHSLKDVPEENPDGLTLTAFPKRERPHDLLITSGETLEELPLNAVVGTSSPRRIMQLQQIRPDLQFKVLRGNLPTRVEKLQTREFDAILLAAAGVNRLNLSVPFAQELSLEQMVPAIGQGALALECRQKHSLLQESLQFLNHHSTQECVLAERSFMKSLGGGCQTPMAAFVKPVFQNKYEMWFSLGLSNVKGSKGSTEFFQVQTAKMGSSDLNDLVQKMTDKAFSLKL